ncbi:MAG: LysR family transcriptional regulator [Eubacteriales bacterium]|nr:LysR family transcriptional regulator [Eubacteriales bacterium]
MLDIRIDSVLTIAECGSFSEAARELGMTQSALSQQIKKLESSLGTQLFRRDMRPMTLTEEGRLYLKYARRLKGFAAEFEEALNDLRYHRRQLRVGITHSAENGRVASVLAEYCRENEGIKIKIVTDGIKNLYTRLKNFELDLVFVEGAKSDPDLNERNLDTDELIVVLGPKHPLALADAISLREILGQELILRGSTSNTRDLFKRALHHEGMSLKQFKILLEVDSLRTIKELVARNYGLSILPRSACLEEVKRGELLARPIKNLEMIRVLKMVWHKTFEDLGLLDRLEELYHELLDA